MRKADYAALAAIIKEQGDRLRDAQNSHAWEIAKARKDAAEDIARQFAGRASVDRAAFLRACGICE